MNFKIRRFNLIRKQQRISDETFQIICKFNNFLTNSKLRTFHSINFTHLISTKYSNI